MILNLVYTLENPLIVVPLFLRIHDEVTWTYNISEYIFFNSQSTPIKLYILT